MQSTVDLVTQIIEQNPEVLKNPKYLILTVWERQGLKLYPFQREKFLSDEISPPATILRAKLKGVENFNRERIARKKRK